MRIDLPAADTWYALSEAYRAELARSLPVFAEPALQVQIYAGYNQALWEITHGLGKLFAHKRTIAIAAPPQDLVFEPIAQAFLGDGYILKSLTNEEIENPKSWLDTVQTELLFVLFAQDDPVTGKVKNHETLSLALKDKRIFRVSLSHASFRYQKLERPAPFDVRILSLKPDRALVVAGERCRVQSGLVRLLPWSAPRAEEVARELAPQSDSLDAILAFENSLPEGFKPYFGRTAARLFDRAAIYSSEFDGSAVMDELSQMTGLELKGPGEDGSIEATSPCRWENPRMKDWLLARGESEEIVRGLILIDGRKLTPDLPLQLAQAAREIRKLQNG